jgi:hypothetical protein
MNLPVDIALNAKPHERILPFTSVAQLLIADMAAYD